MTHRPPRAKWVRDRPVARRAARECRSGYFPWKRLAERGFGLWCDEPLPTAAAAFDAVTALQAIGYDVANPADALRAFRLHYGSDETAPDASERERALLACLRAKLAGGSG